MIFATACNISSDLMLLCIPIPIMIKIRLPMKRFVKLKSLSQQQLTIAGKSAFAASLVWAFST